MFAKKTYDYLKLPNDTCKVSDSAFTKNLNAVTTSNPEETGGNANF